MTRSSSTPPTQDLRAWLRSLRPRAAPGTLDAIEVSTPPTEHLRVIGEFTPRRLAGVVIPESVESLRALMLAAATVSPSPSLYPISAGCNWGAGSRLPVRPGGALLDLSRLTTIRSLDLQAGIALVEPGVTQGQLAAALRDTDWMLNVTGSSSTSSVIGNLLERGIGFVRPRLDDLRALEVLTSEGQTLRTGSWRQGGAPGHQFHNRGGVGPGLSELFLQSNLGIVTAAAIALLRRPERTILLRAHVDLPQLDAALPSIRALLDQRALSTVGKLINGPMLASYGLPHRDDGMLFFAATTGPDELAWAGARHAQRTFAALGIDATLVADDDPEARSEPMAQRLLAIYGGEPQDRTVHELTGSESLDPDRDAKVGWIVYVPAVPCDAGSILAALRLSEEVAEAHGLRASATFNLLDRSGAETLIAMTFPRHDKGAVERAHAALDALHRRFRSAGFALHRSDIDHQRPEDLYDDPARLDLLRRLKEVLDPSGRLSPGRYGLGAP